jgi:predicted deacylase
MLPPRPPAEIRAAAEHNIQVSLTPAETLGIFAELDRLRAVERRAQGVLDLHTGDEQDAARFILTGEWKTPPTVR